MRKQLLKNSVLIACHLAAERATTSLMLCQALRKPGASVVIYGVADALRVPNTDIRLFGKPESNARRRMGVALACDADVEVALVNAKKAAGMVKLRVVS